MDPPKAEGPRAAQILEGLERLVLQRRTLAISFNDLSDFLGISRSLIYVYHDSIPAMLEALSLSHLERIESEVLPFLDASGSFHDRAVASAAAYLRYCADHGPLLQLILREAPGDSPLSPKARARFRHSLRKVASQTASGLRVSGREAFVVLELLAAIPESLARLVNEEAVRRDIALKTCERLIDASLVSLAVSAPS